LPELNAFTVYAKVQIVVQESFKTLGFCAMIGSLILFTGAMRRFILHQHTEKKLLE
jgi:hypothetical protein